MKLKQILFALVVMSFSATQTVRSQSIMTYYEDSNSINTTATANLKGNVKSVKTESFVCVMSNYGVYDKDAYGNYVTSKQASDSDVYIYNADGYLTDHNGIFAIDDGHSAYYKEKIFHNDKGLVSEICIWGDNDELKSRTKFIYNSDFKCIGKREYDESNTLLSSSKCMTDSMGNIIREVEKDISIGYISDISYTYNLRGIRTGYEIKHETGFVTESVNFELDRNNNPVKGARYNCSSDSSVAPSYKCTKFDCMGNWIECIRDAYDDGFGYYPITVYRREIVYAE